MFLAGALGSGAIDGGVLGSDRYCAISDEPLLGVVAVAAACVEVEPLLVVELVLELEPHPAIISAEAPHSEINAAVVR